MKIVIEIEGAEARVQTVRPGESVAAASPSAPPEAMAQAAGIQTLDGGAAPAAGAVSQPGELPPPGSETQTGSHMGVSAGAAPGSIAP